MGVSESCCRQGAETTTISAKDVQHFAALQNSSVIKSPNVGDGSIIFECYPAGAIQLVHARAMPPALIVARIDKNSCFSKTIHGDRGLGNGDMILEVIGVTLGDLDAMQDAIERAQLDRRHISLRVGRRPPVFQVAICKEGVHVNTLGVNVNPYKFPGALWVMWIEAEGLVPGWNMTHCDRMIRVGDLITEVCGVTGTSTQLIEAIKATNPGDTLGLKVEQCSIADTRLEEAEILALATAITQGDKTGFQSLMSKHKLQMEDLPYHKCTTLEQGKVYRGYLNTQTWNVGENTKTMPISIKDFATQKQTLESLEPVVEVPRT